MTAWLPRSLVQDLDAEAQRADVKRLADEVRRQRREAAAVPSALAAPEPEPQQPAAPPAFDLQSHIKELTATWRDDKTAQPAVNTGREASSSVFPSALTAPWRDDRPKPQQQQPAAGAGQTGSASQMPAGTGVAPERAGEYRAYARQVASQYGIDPDIFDRQLTQESGYNPAARSPVGAAGIAQFMPGTAAQYGVDVNDPYSSIDGAARHMRDLLKANGGNYRLALAAYNAGQGNVDKWGEGVFDDDFAEGQTRDYVNIILGPGSARPAQRQSSMNAAGPTAAPSPQPAAGGSSTPAAGLPPSVAQKWRQQFGRDITPDEAAELQQALGMMGVA